jgi:hypothetical protein
MHTPTRPRSRAARVAVASAVLVAAPLATASHAAGAAAASQHAAAPAASRPAAGKSCTPAVTRLPDLGHGGEAVSFNATAVIGDVLDARGRPHPAIWRAGRLTVLRHGIGTGSALDINARGDIIGQNPQGAHAWELRRGQLTFLRDVPGSTGPYARRINSRGQIAGAVGHQPFAARWASASAAPTVLRPRRGDRYSFAKGINDSGVVAGDTDEADLTPHSAVWSPAGHIRVFAGAYGPGSPGDLFEINNAGATAGESYRITGPGPFSSDEATVWSPSGVPAGLGFLPGTNMSTAFGLSQSGYASGGSWPFDYVHFRFLGPPHAFVWPGHGPLLALPVPGLRYTRSESVVHQIDDNATVAGTAGPVGGPDHPYLWTCAFAQAFVPPQTPAVGGSHDAPRPGRAWASGLRWATIARHTLG